MGLAASQARLLLLTSRRSDLEYRAQMISQHKIALAMETEKVATAYTSALNDRHLTYTFWQDPNSSTKVEKDLSYDLITSGYQKDDEKDGSGTLGYRVVDRDGYIVIKSGMSEEQKLAYAAKFVEKAQFQDWDQTAGARTWKADGEAAYDAEVKKVAARMKEYDNLDNNAYFQDLLLSGTLELEQSTPGTTVKHDTVNTPEGQEPEDHNYTTRKWDVILLSGSEDISDVLNTDNDNAAMATYELESKKIQGKDKQLDVELKQVETQLEACKAEQESVKKLLQDHAQKDFQLFS